MKNETKKLLLGLLGEKIISQFLRDKGYIVRESMNIFDSQKDLLVNNKKIEIKTQVPLIYKNSFAINLNQINKILKSDYVFWISVPLNKINDEYAGCIFKMNPHEAKYEYYRKNDVERYLFNRKQDSMKLVYRIKDPLIINQFKQLNSSYL